MSDSSQAPDPPPPASLRCPNCSHPVEREPVVCEVCGFRSENVREYFWLYLGGGAIGLAGLVLGFAGIAAAGAENRSWIAPLRGWLPFGPWPREAHWLSWLVCGIVLSLVGMGFTRHFRSAFWGGVLVASIALLATLRKLIFAAPPPAQPVLASVLLCVELAFLGLLWRLRLALLRTPKRDVRRLQAGPDRSSSNARNGAHRP